MAIFSLLPMPLGSGNLAYSQLFIYSRRLNGGCWAESELCTAMVERDLDFKRALQDPRGVFGTPESVLADPRLDREGKRAILKSWEQDEREMAVAEEEGMGGGEGNMLDRVVNALNTVSDPQPHHGGAASKHGGNVREVRPEPGGKAGSGQARPRGRIKELMRAYTEVVHVDEELREAHVRMRHFRVPFLPVADGDEIVGILTARDVYDESCPDDGGKKEVYVRDRLSKNIAFCYETDDLEMAIDVMEQSGHRRLLVTDDEGLLVGLITLEMIEAALRKPGAGRPRSFGRKTTGRLAETTARAKGFRPGRPWSYAVRPKLRK